MWIKQGDMLINLQNVMDIYLDSLTVTMVDEEKNETDIDGWAIHYTKVDGEEFTTILRQFKEYETGLMLIREIGQAMSDNKPFIDLDTLIDEAEGPENGE